MGLARFLVLLVSSFVLVLFIRLCPADAQEQCRARLNQLSSKLEDIKDKLKSLKIASATCNTVPNAWAAKGMPVCISVTISPRAIAMGLEMKDVVYVV